MKHHSRDGFSPGGGQSNPREAWSIPHLSRSWDEPLSVASLVIQSSFMVRPTLTFEITIALANPSNELDEGSTPDRWLAAHKRGELLMGSLQRIYLTPERRPG